MSMSQAIIENVSKILWPWIKDNVWPIIKQKILDELPNLIEWFLQKIKDLIANKSQQRENEATERAEEAVRRAEQATDQAKADSYRKEAEIWRAVAEQYKNDLADIKSKINNVEKDMKTEFSAEINKLDPDLNFTTGGANVRISGETINLKKPK